MEQDAGNSEGEIPSPELISGIKSVEQKVAEAKFRTGSARLDMLAMEARLKWLTVARPAQIAPLNAWSGWALVTGRGFGKTRSAAEETWWEMIEFPETRAAVVAPTNDDVRHTCFEGESGLLACCPEKLIKSYNRSMLTLELVNGSIIRGFSSEKPDRLRGPQHGLVWLEELAAWSNIEDTWAMLKFGLRLGKNPRKIITTTPKPVQLVRDIINDPSVVVVRGTTYDNKDNLPEKFFEDIVQYEGTALGRQELHGELIDLEEMGIFKRTWFKLWPKSRPYPACELIVQSWDTAFSENQTADYTVCTTWGLFPSSEGAAGYAAILWDAWAEQMSYPDLRKKAIKEYGTKYGPNERRPDIVLIEKKASGQSLIQDLRRANIPVRSWDPGAKDKVQRAHIVSHLVKDGLIYIPESVQPNRSGQFMTWANDMIEQLVFFPNSRNDDYVDSFTQFLSLMNTTGWMISQRAESGELTYWRKIMQKQGGGVYG